MYLCSKFKAMENSNFSICTAKKVQQIIPELSRSTCYDWINRAKKALNLRVLSVQQFCEYYGIKI